jgi:hypothetical protein
MKSFRVYIAPGRVPTTAGWIATAAGVSTVVLAAIILSQIWKSGSAPATRYLLDVKWLLVLAGLAAFALVGGAFRLAGKPLSKPEEK